jgi:hypothetical protein
MLLELERRGGGFRLRVRDTGEELDADLPIVDGGLPADTVELALIDAVYVMVQRLGVRELEEVAGPLPDRIAERLRGREEVRVAFIYTKVMEFMLAAKLLEEAKRQRGLGRLGHLSG